MKRNIKLHFQEIQDMLLRRLRYHYRGTRKDEWRDYNARLNDGVRDFEKITQRQAIVTCDSNERMCTLVKSSIRKIQGMYM